VVEKYMTTYDKANEDDGRDRDNREGGRGYRAGMARQLQVVVDAPLS